MDWPSVVTAIAAVIAAVGADTHSSSSDRQTNFATTARLSPGLRSRCSHDRIAPVRPAVTWSSDSSPSPINRLSKWQLPVAEF